MKRELTIERTRSGLEIAGQLGRKSGRKQQMTESKIKWSKSCLPAECLQETSPATSECPCHPPQDDRKFSYPGCPGGARRGSAMSRPMRFPSRGGRVLLLLFGITLGPFLLLLPASVWLAWTLTPLQKFYLGTYTASSIGATQPRNMTSIRWVLKTAQGRKSIPMLPQDAVAGPNPKIASQPLGSGRRGRLAGTYVEFPGEGFVLRTGPAAPGFDVRRRASPAHPWPAPALWIGGADLRVSCSEKSEGRLGLWTEFLGGPAALGATRTKDQRAAQNIASP